MLNKNAEARRLLARGFKLCKLHAESKRPVGDDWQTSPVQVIEDSADGYGMHLQLNGLCSVDPDNVEPAREGLRRCGFDLDEIMDAGVRTLSNRPGSGGRSTFRAPRDGGVPWLKFGTKDGVILELRAQSSNLQDCLPGTVYRSADGSGPYRQEYAGARRLDEAPDLPEGLRNWWQRMGVDLEFFHEQQLLLCGADALLAVSSGGTLAFASTMRADYNAAHNVPQLLAAHRYTKHGSRFAPPNATGSPSVRMIPGKTDLWRSDHASDALHGTFDAWTANVVLNHGGDLGAAERAWAPQREIVALSGFADVVPEDGSAAVLPAFQRTKAGEIMATKGNVVMSLARPDFCGYRSRYDSFRGEIMIAKDGTEGWRTLRNEDYMRICLRLERRDFLSIKKELIRDAIAFVASKNEFDSAQHWLGNLAWDGTPRIERFLITYFGAADTPYTRAIAVYLWTAMAGRVLQPGIKADMVPVAVGVQGSRKSSAVAAMAPSIDFVGTIDLSAKDDDQARRMRGKLLIELDELKGLSTREAEHIKSFITRTHEEWTPKFVELCTRYARRCVFIGTSNKDDFLADETGNRRWLPFRSGLCDPDGITSARDQLWAEGREVFLQKGILHRDAENLARVEHAEFAEHDQWDTAVKAWLYTPDFDGLLPGNRPYLTSREVLKDAIGLPDSQQGRVHQVRIKRVMLRNHYTEGSLRIHSTKTRVYLPESLF